MKRFFPLTAVFIATALAADLPIREVILYKSGVGYFERAGARCSRANPRVWISKPRT